MIWFVIVAFAISSSIDNLAVAITYGIREIRVGIRENFLMAVICFLMSLGSIYLGMWLSTILPGMVPIAAGAFLLIIIGIRIILLSKPNDTSKKNTSLNPLEYKQDILKHPEMADTDKSGHIGWVEAIFLGVALSANALTNGLGAGLLGFPPLAISLTAAVGSFLSVWFGIKLGIRLSTVRIGKFTIGQFGTILSGIIIIVIAITAFI